MKKEDSTNDAQDASPKIQEIYNDAILNKESSENRKESENSTTPNAALKIRDTIKIDTENVDDVQQNEMQHQFNGGQLLIPKRLLGRRKSMEDADDCTATIEEDVDESKHSVGSPK